VVIKLKKSHTVQGWYTRDDFGEQLSSAVILRQKWSNMKFVYLLGPLAISGM